jgi:hypothetical protein
MLSTLCMNVPIVHSLFSFTDSVLKKKGIAPMSLKEIEKVVHEVRGVK